MSSLEQIARQRAGSSPSVAGFAGAAGGGGGGGGLADIARSRAGVVPAPPQGRRKKKEAGWEGFLRHAFAPGTILSDYLAQHAPWSPVRGAARVFSVLAGSPYEAGRHPQTTTEGAWKSVVGIPEGIAAMEKVWAKEYHRQRHHGFNNWLASFKADYEVARQMTKAVKSDYATRYGKDWYSQSEQQTFSNLFDLLTIVGPGMRGTALVGAGRRLGEAGIERTPASIWREAARPGLLSEGEARSRTLSFRPPESEVAQTLDLPYSRSPLRRGMQEALDQISRDVPGLPGFGAQARVARGQTRLLQRSVDRLLGSVVDAGALNKLSEAGRTRLFWGSQIGDHSDKALAELRDALQREFTSHKPEADQNYSDWMWQAKQAGFGQQMLDRLDKAIAYKPDKNYWKAEQAMRQATDLSENVIADANGFTNLSNDIRRAEDHAIALEHSGASQEAIDAAHAEIDRLAGELHDKQGALEAMFGSRRGRVRDWFDASRIVDTPERQARLAEMSAHPNIGAEQAQGAIRVADALANASGNPEQWWATKVGMPTGEPAQQFVSRFADALYQQPGTRLTGEGGAFEVFYSPLQRWLDNQNWRAMPADQLQATLEKAIPPREFYNAGLDLYFNQFAPGARVSREDFALHLKNPMNAYNLREHYRSNSLLAREAGNYTKWHRYGGGALMSRDPMPGEYHELTLEMPQQGRTAFGQIHHPDWLHWNTDNVAAHVRFHIFEENGVRKLLVDEIQSDWESAFREQKLTRPDIPELPPNALKQARQIKDEMSQLNEATQALHDELTAAENWRGGEGADQIRQQMDQVNQAWEQLDQQLSQIQLVRESPLGPTYHRAVLRRIMREAADQNVDEVVIAHPSTQHIRNMPEHPLLDPGSYRSAEDVTAYMQRWGDQGGSGMPLPVAERLYGKTFPDFIQKEYGLTPVRTDAAYQGRYAAQGGTFSAPGDMPGTSFQMTPEARAQALKPQPLYQRQPNWGALPKGAMETLQNGDRLIHLFKGADVSTWIHELSHSAIHDLSAADQKILADHYANGAALDAWKDTAHESYARDFEMWMREGHAPTRSLHAVFQKVGEWMRVIYKTVARKEELPPQVHEVFGRMFVRHDNTPDIFIPHRANKVDLSGARTSRGIPRAGREIGDQVQSRIPLFKHNTLSLMRSGMLSDDPRHLLEHTNRVVMMARANQLREAVLEISRPLHEGEHPNFETQYVVKRAGSGVDKPTFDALESADDPAAIRATIKSYLDDKFIQNPEEYRRYLETKNPNEKLYVVDRRTVDMLFKNATGKAPGATTAPKSSLGKVGDALLDSTRALLLYGNPGFYMANMVGNAWMSTIADPRALRYLTWGMSNAVKEATGRGNTDPLFHQISVEMGRGPTAGQLSSDQSFLGQTLQAKGSRVAGTAEYLGTKVPRWWGSHSGRIIDDSFRVGAWRQAARKHGYKTAEEQQALLDAASGQRTRGHLANTKARKDLQAIRDEAENLMLDFDSMTPFEKTYLARIVFLYPFLRASAKYPIMFAGERPLVAGLTGQLGVIGAKQGDQAFGPRSALGLPAWAQGYSRLGSGRFLNIGSVSPVAPALGLLESAMNVGRPAEIGVNRPLSYLYPAVQLALDMARSQNKYGRDAPAWQIFRQDAPMPGYLAQLLQLRNPSSQYTGQSELDALLRSLRVVPFGMTTGNG